MVLILSRCRSWRLNMRKAESSAKVKVVQRILVLLYIYIKAYYRYISIRYLSILSSCVRRAQRAQCRSCLLWSQSGSNTLELRTSDMLDRGYQSNLRVKMNSSIGVSGQFLHSKWIEFIKLKCCRLIWRLEIYWYLYCRMSGGGAQRSIQKRAWVCLGPEKGKEEQCSWYLRCRRRNTTPGRVPPLGCEKVHSCAYTQPWSIASPLQVCWQWLYPAVS